MVLPLKVKILKKTKDIPWARHILVERSATREMVHLYFVGGRLSKFIYIAPKPQTKKIENTSPKVTFPFEYVVQEVSLREEGKMKLLKSFRKQNFFEFSASPHWDTFSIGFKTVPEKIPSFFVEMDLGYRCRQNDYIRDHGAAEIQEVYPRQGRRRWALKNINQNVR